MVKNNIDDLRVRRTHKLLYQALLELMEKQTFESITVREICDVAMVHRTTFYTHFQDKYDLLSRAIRKIAEDEFELTKNSLTPAESINEVFTVAIKHKKLFAQLLLEERDSLRNILRREMEAGIRLYLRENNTFEEDSIDARIYIEAYIGAVLGVLNWWLDNDMPIDQRIIYEKMLSFEKMGMPF